MKTAAGETGCRHARTALADALLDLVGMLGRPDTIGDVYEIGGPEALTYRDIMVIASRVMDRRRVIAPCRC